MIKYLEWLAFLWLKLEMIFLKKIKKLFKVGESNSELLPKKTSFLAGCFHENKVRKGWIFF